MQRITENDVVRAYKMILGRSPESLEIIQEKVEAAGDVWGLVNILINSEEFKNLILSSDEMSRYTGINDGDIELLKKYMVNSAPMEGYLIDFIGSKTDINFNKSFENLSGVVEALPVPCSAHAEAIEWIGMIKAVEEAKDKFTVVELGAGWGPWMVSSALAAQKKKIDDIYMIGVEADEGHFEMMEKHIMNNGFSISNCKLLRGIVADRDGYAFFPIINSKEDWGAAAVISESDIPPKEDYRGRTLKYKKMKAFSIERIIENIEIVDFMHIDIQGAERQVIPKSIGVLNKKVKLIVLGTHSRIIEGEMMELFSAHGWKLINEKPCRFNLHAITKNIDESATTVDGTQVWKNKNL